MTLSRLTTLLALAVLVLLRGEYAGVPWQVYVAKPAATLLVMAIAMTGDAAPDAYRRLVVRGLLFSLAGDILLMVPGDYFVAGLVAFLVAHLWYIAAFTRDGGFSHGWTTAVPLGATGAAVLVLLWPGLGALRIPVIVYVLVIVAMAWQALERWRLRAHAGAALAAMGALFFMASDASLGYGRFRSPLPGSRALVLLTYYMAQWCIAVSVRRRARRTAPDH
jgi:uncharacterized membrane protein YhhN